MRIACLLMVVSVMALGVGAVAPLEPRMNEPDHEEMILFDFSAGAEPWPNIDDTVMGGVSRSAMGIDGGVAIFEGVLSLENNGGFASVRSRPANHDLSGFDGIALRIFGDGKTYGVRLRTDSRFDGVSYQAKLTPEADRWTTLRIPFADFVPVFRGRRLERYPSLAPGEVKSFGLIISDKQEGAFRLAIESIRAYRAERPGE